MVRLDPTHRFPRILSERSAPDESKDELYYSQLLWPKVEVVTQMENCTLICFHGRTFIVDTADLTAAPGFKP